MVEIEGTTAEEEVASEGIGEIQTVEMIVEEEAEEEVEHATLATDLDTLLEIALMAEEMIVGEEVALEGIEVAAVEVAELATIVTEKDIWQETVQKVIGEIEEEDNFHVHKKTD